MYFSEYGHLDNGKPSNCQPSRRSSQYIDTILAHSCSGLPIHNYHKEAEHDGCNFIRLQGLSLAVSVAEVSGSSSMTSIRR